MYVRPPRPLSRFQGAKRQRRRDSLCTLCTNVGFYCIGYGIGRNNGYLLTGCALFGVAAVLTWLPRLDVD
jgi:hypothetical protein